ncbi:hypothetical protein [Variovorax sp. PCZ-1]|uniref:hypothetical protein n=1 Tax=Variovorax sp. PCZ-1 TaxID=2835533 RepID=UPI001BCF49B5|nr:hypothetical protein [Variovorax sp. PCZ-1]MBS7808159.1 hypothetical protein [Variovorax sp. PCZ-1]
MSQPPKTTQPKPAAVPVSAASAPQARLILQDPLAFEQATQPSLRSSSELSIEPGSAGMEREKARDLWESLSLDPEVAQERQSERKRLLLRADNLARESAAAKAQAIELQAQLAKAHDERLNHPLVYAGAAGLIGMGALWFLERRKRMALQERELEMLAQQSPDLTSDVPADLAVGRSIDDAHTYLPQQGSTFSLEDSPDLADDFATDLAGLPESKAPSVSKATEPSIAPVPTLKTEVQIQPASRAQLPQQAPGAEPLVHQKAPAASTPDWAQPKSDAVYAEDGLQDMSWQKPERSLLSMSKQVLGNMLRRRSQRDVLVSGSSSHIPTEIQSSTSYSTGTPSTVIHERIDDATQMLYDEQAQEAFEQELLAQQLSAGLNAGYNPDQANIDLLSQTRVTPQRGESAMEHLLELRTAVNGLCALNRPEGAAKLLEEYVATDPATCAWAYLEYMQICEQIGWREEFELMRKRYRQQFNRMAPYWHEPNSNVLGLDGYARAAGELCTAWSQGVSHSQQTLASWLVGPLLGRKLVQLPAYHDLFDLYEMLEFVALMTEQPSDGVLSDELPLAAKVMNGDLDANAVVTREAQVVDIEQDFVPTVSLLDLDYEFSSDVTLEESEVRQAEKAVTIVKTGNFSVDFNVAGTQLGALSSLPAELAKK